MHQYFRLKEVIQKMVQDMGSSVSSVHKNSDSSAMKFRASKSRKSLVPSPTLNGENPVSQFGTKEEMFFDSQPWLDSDCDDDYLSVAGDFTPSRGSTSLDYISSPKPQLSKPQLIDNSPVNIDSSLSSPTDKKRRLSELLQESTGEEVDNQNVLGTELKTKLDDLVQPSPSKSTNVLSNLFPYLSKSSSVRSSDTTPNRYMKSETPNRYMKTEKTKPEKTSQCCLPSLLTSLSFNERKKKLSPDLSAGG